jgi:hypothetical protein
MASDPLLKLLPYGLGGTALLAAGLWAAKQYFSKILDTLATSTPAWVARLAGRRSSPWGKRYHRYRRAIQTAYASHAIGLGERSTIDVAKMYVPLQYEDGEQREDIYERIRQEPRTVVVGPAGAGKSLLLKNSMLLWAFNKNDQGRAPVLIELHRCSDGKVDFVDLIKDELCRPRRRAVRNVESFIHRELEDGRLRMLFDGLDEVGRDDHDRVVRALRDFALAYPECQMVVTCRSAAYYNQLAPEFAHVVRVADFDDASVRRFLGKWPGIGSAADVDRIFSSLRNSPPIMRLARSPLLLTMIAYLQTTSLGHTGSTLPNSRPAFYQIAISHLLARDRLMGRPTNSVYKPADKLSVLQRVALELEESMDGDRLAITRTRLVQITCEILPDLNLGAEHADKLLDEIIDRSQLLEKVDENGSRFRFPHLTFQEYFAAQELAKDSKRLLDNYTADPDSWREIVRLWCAEGSADCTEVVRAVFKVDDLRHRVLALECLADAARIDAVFAEEIIEYFLTRLPFPSDFVLRAFGSVAADNRPRGQKVLKRLMEVADDPYSGPGGAMSALSASGRSEAAEFLAACSEGSNYARVCLQAMGEPAVPALGSSARQGRLWAVEALAKVATPIAAQELAKLLWSGAEISHRAAWRLAELLPYADIEEGLREFEPPGLVPSLSLQYNWVWQPLANGATDSLAIVAGLVAGYIDTSPGVPDDLGTIDSRIGIPIIGIKIAAGRRRFTTIGVDSFAPLVAALCAEVGYTPASGRRHVPEVLTSAAVLVKEPGPAAKRLRDALFDANWISSSDRRAIGALRWPVQATMLGTILGKDRRPSVDRKLWLAAWQTPRSSRNLRRLTRMTLVVAALAVAGIGGFRAAVILNGSWPWGPVAASWGIIAALLVGAAGWVISRRRTRDRIFFTSRSVFSMGSVYVCCYGSLLAVVTALSWIGWTGLILVLAAILGPVPLAVAVADRRDAAAINPLRQCLEADAQTISDRTSVLAK